MRPDPYAWTSHPEAVLGLVALFAAYAWAARTHRPSSWRAAAFGAGILLLLVTSVSPLESLSFHLLTAHLLQNVVLAEWAPALLVLGVPPALAAAIAGRLPGAHVLLHPAFTLPAWIGTYFVWHLPPLYDRALHHPHSLLHLEHGCYIAAGTLLWWPVIQDAPVSLKPQLRAAYLFAAFVLASPLGLLLALLPDPVYDFYAGGFPRWSLSALEDQQIAGVTMAAEQAVVFFAVFAFFFFRFLAEEERGTDRP
ncbi:MAG: cytochrome c oxidase assembly protein [Pseudomonadota bacterium]